MLTKHEEKFVSYEFVLLA